MVAVEKNRFYSTSLKCFYTALSKADFIVIIASESVTDRGSPRKILMLVMEVLVFFVFFLDFPPYFVPNLVTC